MRNQLTSPIWLIVYCAIAIATVTLSAQQLAQSCDQLTIADIIELNALYNANALD